MSSILRCWAFSMFRFFRLFSSIVVDSPLWKQLRLSGVYEQTRIHFTNGKHWDTRLEMDERFSFQHRICIAMRTTKTTTTKKNRIKMMKMKRINLNISVENGFINKGHTLFVCIGVTRMSLVWFVEEECPPVVVGVSVRLCVCVCFRVCGCVHPCEWQHKIGNQHNLWK